MAGVVQWYDVMGGLVSCAFVVGCSACSNVRSVQGVAVGCFSRVWPVVIVVLVVIMVVDWYIIVIPNRVCS